MHKRGLYLYLCISLCTDAAAQRYPFIQYTPKDGLANSRVRTMRQDAQGRLLFATSGGLSVYDGASFTNYSRQQGLANEAVNDVFEAGPDSFLVATNTHQLNTLVRGRIGIYPGTNDSCPIINQFLLTQDKQLYLGTDEGLFKLADQQLIHVPLFSGGSAFSEKNLSFILEWNHFLLIRNWSSLQAEKLIVFDRKKEKAVDVFTGFTLDEIKVDPRTHEIIVLANQKSYQLDTTALLRGRIHLVPYPAHAPDGQRYFAKTCFDNNREQWFYNASTVGHIRKDGKFQGYSIGNGLEATNITDLFFDRENILWILTDGSGVIKLTNTAVSLQPAVFEAGTDFTLDLKCAGDSTWFYQPFRKRLLCFTRTDTLFYPVTFLKEGFFYASGKSAFLSDAYTIYFIPDKNNPRAYTSPRVLYRLNPSKGEKFGKAITDASGNLYISIWSTDSYSLLRINTDNHFLFPMKAPMDELHIDRSNRLWIIDRLGNLFVFLTDQAGKENGLKLLHRYHDELPSFSPRAFTTDRHNNLWIGTRYNGLYKISMEGLKITGIQNLTTADGLLDNFIYALACSPDNVVWAGSQNGLDKIGQVGGKLIIENISKNNNIFETVTTVMAGSDNVIWARSSQGNIIRVENQPQADAAFTPSLFFTGIRVNGKPVADDHSGSFNSQEKSFSFSVAAPSFLDEKAIRYSYLLDGSPQPAWTRSLLPVFNFLNLAPGKYTLRVRADFPTARYPSRELQYQFEISPPWWQTGWFVISATLITATLLFLLTRFYYHRKLEKQRAVLVRKQAIERERTRIATDMHDDLGAGLSRIKFLSETIGLNQQGNKPIEKDISLIRAYADEMIGKMGEIVWALNEKNDSLSDLIAYTRSYGVDYLLQNGIQVETNISDKVPPLFVNGEIRRNVFLTFKEALHNIVKHSEADKVYLSISTATGLTVTIRDNGKGFDPTSLPKYRNGLNNMTNRIREIGGTLEITGTNGTTIHFSVPLSV